MSQPCIKGMTLAGVVEDVRRLCEEGRISEEKLAGLEAEELAWLDEKIQSALWYSIGGYTRLTELLLEVEGRGDPDYMIRRGAAAADRLFDSGVYAQLLHGERRREEELAGGREFTEHDGRLMTTLSGSIFNFGEWALRLDGDEVVIEAADTAALPEVSRLAAQGLIARIVSRVRGAEITVESTRPEPDRVVFRFPRR